MPEMQVPLRANGHRVDTYANLARARLGNRQIDDGDIGARENLESFHVGSFEWLQENAMSARAEGLCHAPVNELGWNRRVDVKC